ncbi:hypothetical protein [Brevundimonas subvibrioides]|uniref:hypothetical protein n=1 Tax=Brevundimonas subvibrioides TaxID=74313 RepID=UPI0032D59294
MTALQIRSVADARYPADVRGFLDTLGYQALYRDDLERALAVGAATPPAAAAPDAGASARPDRPRRRGALAANLLRLAVLAMAVAAGGLILQFSLPKLRAEPASPGAVRPASATPALVPPPEDSPCRQALRTDASAWCESALTGTRAQGPTAAATREACGSPLAANSDTVRLALNGLLDDGVTETYGPAEARQRCATAAALAVPR